MQSSYYETKTEYSISKALFLKYITMPDNVSKIGTMLVTNILSLFKLFVENTKNNTAIISEKNLLYFGKYSNSATEDCNNGMKSNSAPVRPSNKLHRSLTILTKNAIRKEEMH